MQKLIDFDVPHISAYAMSVEKKTALDYFIKQGKTAAMDEEQSAAQMLMMIDTLTRNRFEHYEISNFAKNGHYAKHNTNYWKGRHYLGLGPSAHSFNGVSRSWNIANNQKYIQAIRQQDSFYETEILSIQNRINEYIMTALRTMWGINLSHIEKIFGQDIATQIIKEAQTFLDYGQLELKGNHLVLSSSGKVIADHIMSELFFVE